MQWEVCGLDLALSSAHPQQRLSSTFETNRTRWSHWVCKVVLGSLGINPCLPREGLVLYLLYCELLYEYGLL